VKERGQTLESSRLLGVRVPGLVKCGLLHSVAGQHLLVGRGRGVVDRVAAGPHHLVLLLLLAVQLADLSLEGQRAMIHWRGIQSSR
jgi:hypothetical protein